MRRFLISILALIVLCSVSPAEERSGSPIRAKHEEPGGAYTGDLAYDADAVARLAALTGPAPCVNGRAADLFGCDGVDLESFVALTDLRAAPDYKAYNKAWAELERRTEKTIADGTMDILVLGDGVKPYLELERKYGIGKRFNDCLTK